MCEANDKIVDRIKKLLAMTGEAGATEGEIANAVGRAQKMMNEHHLTEADLNHEPQTDYDKVKPEDFTRQSAYVSRQIYAWEQRLASFVSSFVGVELYQNENIELVRKHGIVQFDEKGKPKEGKSFVYYGVPEDAAIAVELYGELRSTIATMAIARFGGCYRSEGASYSEGFVSGLFTKIAKAKDENKRLAVSSTALVLIARRDDLVKYKMDLAKDWLAESIGIELCKGGGRPGSRVGNSQAARKAGFVDGQNSTVSANRSKKLA